MSQLFSRPRNVSPDADEAKLENIKAPLTCLLNELYERYLNDRSGALADYIPELTKIDPDLFGIAVVTPNGRLFEAGRTMEPVTIQSISKALTFGLALQLRGRVVVNQRVTVEPSGDAFNSIISLDDQGRPANPMINAGAIATTDLLQGATVEERLKVIDQFYADFAGRQLTIDENVYQSEKATGHRNRAIANLLLGFGKLDHPFEETLSLYFKQCSYLVTARDLAVIAATLASGGKNPITGVQVLNAEYVADVLSVMYTCGMYDYAGTWSYDVGLPAKSGVGGGIIAVSPKEAGIATVSPLLSEKGNSIRGVKVCKVLSRNYGLHVFDPRPNPFCIKEAMEPYEGEYRD